MPTRVLEVIKKRCSVRQYKEDPVPRELIEQILEAARWAPSAGNLQPWFFYVITDAGRRRCLAAAAWGQKFVGEAPVLIVVCAEPQRSAQHYGERGRSLYCIQDTAAAIQNLLLAATAYGLGTCWVGAFDENQVRHCLGIPPERRPVAIVTLGYPQSWPEKRTSRRPLDEIVKFM
ncbi:nitroreductase [Ammonifex degensii KC4]|uniref:Nitroreductase n=1 Tax=Ammonifex degensii (strain DSM 10501 / KC4) TaxID=429009 RepID=C9RD51_AMMDK|nr:nitroreductase family protein [Ammonifex degensii]ACX52178.1 nitroreductase [Ammonifex degensii KC4]